MPTRLPGITVQIDGRPARGSTTVGTIGSDVIVFATALPELGLTLTSSCLVVADGATVGVTQRHSSHRVERLRYREHNHEPSAVGSLASACLLEHARDLCSLVASHDLQNAHVGVDIDDEAIEIARRSWSLTRTV